MDNLTTEQRKLCMGRIRSSNTKPELIFRRSLWRLGYRGYRINNIVKGKPDLYFPKKRIAVFIDGCFWHKCPQCFKKPKTKNEYWDIKIDKNVTRDIDTNKYLDENNITVLRFWEHQIKKDLMNTLNKFKNIYENK